MIELDTDILLWPQHMYACVMTHVQTYLHVSYIIYKYLGSFFLWILLILQIASWEIY